MCGDTAVTRTPRFAIPATIVVLALSLGACRTVGPSWLVVDRLDYADALSRSWKEQMLANLVRLRYAEAPVFLDIASVIAQYSLEGDLTVAAQFPDLSGRNAVAAGGGRRWADRPTITFQPLSGQRFTRSLLTPVSPAVVMSLIQAGWSASHPRQASSEAKRSSRSKATPPAVA